MQIRARMSMSADGYITTPTRWPALRADPAFVSGESLAGCEAELMGRTTFEPALTNERWPWPNLNVFVRSDGSATRDADWSPRSQRRPRSA
jgi:dihydrofolate reductase